MLCLDTVLNVQYLCYVEILYVDEMFCFINTLQLLIFLITF